MCDPLSLTIATTVASAGQSIFSGMQQSAGYRAQARYQDRQATLEGQRGAYEARRTREQNTRRLADMRGQYLSEGVALEGSPASVIEDSATQASLDEQAIRFGAQLRSDNYRAQARMSRANAGNAMIGGFVGAAGEALSGYAGYQDYRNRRTYMMNPYLTYGA